ncbi:MAG: ATP-binding domain-containing protein [Prevotella sp.]|nr:ATP-binding domain-containing protein [Prevotella sp.]
MAKRSFYVKDSELDDYQVKVINKKTDNSYIVKGCAGSGKSILALWKAKQIQEQNKGSYLYVVYTKALKRYMSDGIKQVGLRESNVANFDACFNYGRNDNGELERGSWKKGTYDYIIVDEAQDFSREDIELLRSKTRKALLVYGDTAQQLYKFLKDKQTVSMEDIQWFTKFPVEQLVFNHRLPKKVARVAQYLNSESDELEERCTEEGTEKPKILSYPNKKAQFAAIASLIKNKGMEDVGILFRRNEDVDEAYDYFTEAGIEVEAKSYRHKDELDFTSDNPKLMTYHSSKGLQFENVFVPECTAEGEDNRNPLYVAITRTYRSLYIMHSGNLSSFFDDVPTDLYDQSLTTGPTLKL